MNLYKLIFLNFFFFYCFNYNRHLGYNWIESYSALIISYPNIWNTLEVENNNMYNINSEKTMELIFIFKQNNYCFFILRLFYLPIMVLIVS